MEKLLAAIGIGIFAVLFIVLISLLLALPVMLLWNWLVPVIFHLTELSLVQAWGLNVLCGVLFRTSCNVSSK